MAASKRKKNKGGRKLEFAIYFVGILLILLALLGLIKFVKSLPFFQSETESTPASQVASEIVTSLESEPAPSSESTSSVDSQEDPQSESSQEEVSSKGESEAESTENEVSSAPQSNPSDEKSDYIDYTKSGAAELDEWYLLLVNPDNSIADDWETDMTDIGGQRLDSRIVEAYYDLVEAAGNDGASLWCASGYRSYSTQSYLYDNELDEVKQEHPQLDQKQAEDKAASVVARPGTSEHQTGLAIDFNYVEESFGSTKEGKWLKEHAHEYGFILRYDEGKQSLTKVIWEPWHYRFVGVKHATRMKQLGYCLEEYVEHIRNGGN